MTKKIKTLDETPVDVVEAVKRAFIWHGLIPRKYVRQGISKADIDSGKEKSPVISEPTAQKKDTNHQKTLKKDNKDSGETDSEPGSQEAAKDPEEQEPGEVHEKLIDITEKAHDVLFKADTVFPFTLFPDTVTLDREKLSVASRSFFRVAKIITVPITSLISAEAQVGPFFGSIQMTSKYFINNTHTVHFLWRDDATEIHRLLQGFIIAQEKGLDVAEVDKEDLRTLLYDLGQGVSD